ncbi:hypothetical protein, partial [Fulvivirga sp. M361]|uniref:hypothetical protein n=1 Tax=Fulvivirga sp. M361 TaxID=2594266 RepID=UPI001C8854A5
SVQTPQSGLLQCVDHSKPPCAYATASATRVPLASLLGTTPASTGLSPFGTLNFMSYIHHSRHTQCV